MGLFDKFYIRKKCPYCKKESKLEFQAYLVRGLYEFQRGSVVKLKTGEGTWTVGNGKLNGYASCHCNWGNLFYGDIIIKAGKFVDVKNIRKVK